MFIQIDKSKMADALLLMLEQGVGYKDCLLSPSIKFSINFDKCMVGWLCTKVKISSRYDVDLLRAYAWLCSQQYLTNFFDRAGEAELDEKCLFIVDEDGNSASFVVHFLLQTP